MRRFARILLLLVLAVAAHAATLPTRHVRAEVADGSVRMTGHLDAGHVLTLDLVLPLRNSAELQKLLAGLYDPASVSYRQFLTPEEFTARFGPTEADYAAVRQFARESGFSMIGGSRSGGDVTVRGTVAQVEAAFQVSIHTYEDAATNRVFYAPDREPTSAVALWHVSGLDDAEAPRAHVVTRAEYAAAHGLRAENLTSDVAEGSGPAASYLGSDMRAAYYGAGPLTGAGQNMGLVEFSGTDLADVSAYLAETGQTNTVPVNLLSVDGSSTACTWSSADNFCDDTEPTLDVTQALGMAPGLESLTLFVGQTDTAILAALTTHAPLVTTIGCSWSWTPTDVAALEPYFERMAAQGQSFFASTGDDATWSSANPPYPAEDANVTAVGGTVLVTDGGAWAGETAWSGSGGGVSPEGVAIPAWQAYAGVITAVNGGSLTLRNGPDVAANADYDFFVCSRQQTCTADQYGGTSFAAPMWAAFAALVNQQLAANGRPDLGLLNPLIYKTNLDASTYAANFHDVVSGASGDYAATVGYDLVTGWGSPSAELIDFLAGIGPVVPLRPRGNPAPRMVPANVSESVMFDRLR